jgi:hypothetical protein
LALTAAGLHALRDEQTRTIEPACTLAAETLTLERMLKAECRKKNEECRVVFPAAAMA